MGSERKLGDADFSERAKKASSLRAPAWRAGEDVRWEAVDWRKESKLKPVLVVDTLLPLIQPPFFPPLFTLNCSLFSSLHTPAQLRPFPGRSARFNQKATTDIEQMAESTLAEGGAMSLSRLRTSFPSLTWPLIGNGPMIGAACPSLAAAVSQAGGLGMAPAASFLALQPSLDGLLD